MSYVELPVEEVRQRCHIALDAINAAYEKALRHWLAARRREHENTWWRKLLRVKPISDKEIIENHSHYPDNLNSGLMAITVERDHNKAVPLLLLSAIANLHLEPTSDPYRKQTSQQQTMKVSVEHLAALRNKYD